VTLPAGQHLATFGFRTLAQLLDALPLIPFYWILVAFPRALVPLGQEHSSLVFRPYYPYIVAALVYIAYHGLFVGLKGATPGKKLLSIKVCAEDGTPCRPVRGLLRALVQALTPLAGLMFYPLLMRAAEQAPRDELPAWVASALDPVAISLALGGLLYLCIPYDRHRGAIHDQVARTIVLGVRRG
jgi:uncharacterized RDD family membrane protein YckC